jgi:hypothetical protein
VANAPRILLEAFLGRLKKQSIGMAEGDRMQEQIVQPKETEN